MVGYHAHRVHLFLHFLVEIKAFVGKFGVTRQVKPHAAKRIFVSSVKQLCGMNLATRKLRQLFYRTGGGFVGCSTDIKSGKNIIRLEHTAAAFQ